MNYFKDVNVGKKMNWLIDLMNTHSEEEYENVIEEVMQIVKDWDSIKWDNYLDDMHEYTENITRSDAVEKWRELCVGYLQEDEEIQKEISEIEI